MDHSLSDVFNRYFENIKFDARLAGLIYRFQINMTTMSPDHIQFFGSNLLGVHTLRFVPKDILRFFNQVLNVDYAHLERDVRRLKTIYHDNSITADIFNLTLMYLIHRFYTTPLMAEKKRERAAYDVALIFCYRCLFALNNNYFSFNADQRIAQAAYANLSNKNLIKQLGTWKKLCDYRAARLVEKTRKSGEPGQNYEKLYLFNDDIVITGVISDSAGRFKDVMRTYYDEFDRVYKDGGSIGSRSATITDADGDEVLKEKTKSVESYITYARGVINDPDGWVKSELIGVIADLNSNTSHRMIRSTLEWMVTANTTPKYSQLIDKFISDVIVQGMYYIEYNIPITRRRDYGFVIVTLKNMFLSTRSTDKDLLAIREQGKRIVLAENKGISDSLMMATRTAIILYVLLRVLTGYQAKN